jgi:hypothetical protein
VSLYAVGGGNGGGPRAGTVLSKEAIVIGVGGGGGDRLRGDQTTVDVAVPPDEAPLLTQAASAGAVAVALIPDGTKVGEPPPPAPEKQARKTPDAGTSQPSGGARNPGGTQSPGGTQTPAAGGPQGAGAAPRAPSTGGNRPWH